MLKSKMYTGSYLIKDDMGLLLWVTTIRASFNFYIYILCKIEEKKI